MAEKAESAIRVEVDPNTALIMFVSQHAVQRDVNKDTGVTTIWLKNGHGVRLWLESDGSCNLQVIRRAMNQEFKNVGETLATATGHGLEHDVTTKEVLDVLSFLLMQKPFMRRDMRLNTMPQLMRWAKQTGNYFFESDNARHTQRTVARSVHNSFGPSGAFFVTGEIMRAGERRKYTVRRAWFSLKANTGHGTEQLPYLNIENASGFQEFLTPEMAVNDAASRAHKVHGLYMFLPDKQRGPTFPPR